MAKQRLTSGDEHSRTGEAGAFRSDATNIGLVALAWAGLVVGVNAVLGVKTLALMGVELPAGAMARALLVELVLLAVAVTLGRVNTLAEPHLLPPSAARLTTRAAALALDAFFVTTALRAAGLMPSVRAPSEALLASIAAMGAYNFLFEATLGATPAKVVLGLGVIMSNGERCSPRAALARCLGWCLDGIACGMGALVLARASGARQRFGDRLANTVVVERPRSVSVRLPLALACLSLLGFYWAHLRISALRGLLAYVAAETHPDNGISEYARDCDGGDGHACFILGGMLERESDKTQDTLGVAKTFQRGCDLKDPSACYNLGVMHEYGRRVRQDYARGAELYRAACRGKVAVACYNLGVLYANGHGVEADAAEAARLYRLACDGKDAEGCYNLGVAYDNGKGVEESYPNAVSFYRLACDGHEADGCFNLARAYLYGVGVAEDRPRAAALFTQACNAGSGDACQSLNVCYLTGLGVDQDFAKAVAFAKRACDKGQRDGCFNAAAAYSNGVGVGLNEAVAIAFYGKACDAGHDVACYRLALISEAGKTSPPDAKRASELFAKACDAGLADACYHLALHLKSGVGVGRDEARAHALMRESCRADVSEACTDARRSPSHSGVRTGYPAHKP
jgi:TPR repeat protein/uncharacterized RDD family membrane protein YckC